METEKKNTRKQFLRQLVAYGTAIMALCAIYKLYSDSKKDENIKDIQGIVIGPDKKPMQVCKVWLKSDYKKSTTVDTSGRFLIQKVQLSPSTTKVQLRIQLVDSSIHEIEVKCEFEATSSIVSLDLIILGEDEKPEPFDLPNETSLALNTTAVVNTVYHPLTLRDSPSQNGTRIEKVPKNAEVIIINYVGDTETINGKVGKWCYISYNGLKGYAFGGYLLELSTI